MLPADNVFVQIMKLLFCFNLVLSFPFTILPTFQAVDVLVINKKETATLEDEILSTIQSVSTYRERDQEKEEDEDQVALITETGQEYDTLETLSESPA